MYENYVVDPLLFLKVMAASVNAFILQLKAYEGSKWEKKQKKQ